MVGIRMLKRTSEVCFVFHFVLHVTCYAQSSIWSWVLNSPLPLHSVDASHADAVAANLTNNKAHQRGDPKLEELLSNAGVTIECSRHEHCDVGMFCDSHYGYCDRQRGHNNHCREDRQCEDRLVCMFGSCQVPIRRGFKGSRCRTAADCNAGLCCARQHGERVCKPRPTLGQKCYVPQGGLEYILNEACPCDRGLVCRHPNSIPLRKRERDFDLWPDVHEKDTSRCELVSADSKFEEE